MPPADPQGGSLPHPAASVLLVRDNPLRVLLMRRPDRRGDAYASTLVFPGGTVEEQDRDALLQSNGNLAPDERALRTAAFRELFEETGILVGGEGRPPADACFADLVAARRLALDADRLVPFGHWITPEIAPKRFDTHFFLCAAPPDAEARCGAEAVAVAWIAPGEALRAAEAGEIAISFPTRMNLKRLAESATLAEAVAAAHVRPPFTVRPMPVRRDGRTIVTIPAKAGYGVTEGAA